MSTVINITHDAGSLAEYTATSGANVSAAAAAALAGTAYGMQAVIASTTAQYGYKNTSTKFADLRARLYVDANSLTMANGDQFEIFRVSQNGGGYNTIVSLQLAYATATGYAIKAYCRNDANSNVVDDSCNVTDAPHYIEIHEVRAASDSSADGTFQWWVDGANQGLFTGIDNYNFLGDQNARFILGAISSIDAGTSGTLYLDELRANDDGSVIGAWGSLALMAVVDMRGQI